MRKGLTLVAAVALVLVVAVGIYVGFRYTFFREASGDSEPAVEEHEGPTGSGDPTGGDPVGDGPSEGDLPTGVASLGDLGSDLAPGYGLLYVNFDHSADSRPAPGVEPGIPGGTLYAAIPWDQPGLAVMQEVAGGVAWAPDGKAALAICRKQGTADTSLVLAAVDGTSNTLVAALPFPDFVSPHTPGFSPDGSYLTVLDGMAMESSLHVLTWSGKKLATLDLIGPYVWAPDGSAIAYAAPQELDTPIPLESGRSASLYLYDLETGEETLLVEGDETYLIYPADWTEDYGLIYRKSDWADYSNDSYWHLDLENLAAGPERAVPTRGDSVENLKGLIPVDLIASWAGQVKLSPDRTTLIVSTVDSTGELILYAVNVQTGAYGRVGEGDFFYWSPMPAAGTEG